MFRDIICCRPGSWVCKGFLEWLLIQLIWRSVVSRPRPPFNCPAGAYLAPGSHAQAQLRSSPAAHTRCIHLRTNPYLRLAQSAHPGRCTTYASKRTHPGNAVNSTFLYWLLSNPWFILDKNNVYIMSIWYGFYTIEPESPTLYRGLFPCASFNYNRFLCLLTQPTSYGEFNESL